MSDEKKSTRDLKTYWRHNIVAVAALLAIWALVGYGFSIALIEQLNQVHIGKLGLGFWFAQQGSIYVFVGLVLTYALWMDRLDRRFGVEER